MAADLFSGELVLLHNPRCSKSRSAKAFLVQRGAAFREHHYLEQPLSRAQLSELARRLGRPAQEWVRDGEDAYAEAGLDQSSSQDQILDAMARFPILLERPILIRGAQAIVGRPPEKVLELLEARG